MLRSEINELEKSIGAVIELSSTTTEASYSREIRERVSYVQNLCAELKKKWTHELLSSAKDQVIKRYIQYHEAGIVQLSDSVSKEVPALSFSVEVQKVQSDSFSIIESELEKILDFLRHHFYQYFDLDHKATIYYSKQLLEQVLAFQDDLSDINDKAVENSLTECVIISAEEIAIEGTIAGISYRQGEQALNIIRAIHHLLTFGSNVTIEKLIRIAYQQNMNSLYFYNWYRQYIYSQTTLIEDKTQKDDFIKVQIKTFEGIFVSPDKALHPELASTNLYIIPWLQEQIATDQKHSLVTGTISQFPLNLSVPQFALFIRIFYKTGCFPIENVAQITRFFTEHFTTKKQDHISAKSFGRAFYNLDQSAAAVVRDFLQKMINYINKTYFP